MKNNTIIDKFDNFSVHLSFKDQLSDAVNGSQLYELQHNSKNNYVSTITVKKQLRQILKYSSKELKNIKTFYDLFHNKAISVGFQRTSNPFVHEDYLHNRNPEFPNVLQYQYMNVDSFQNHILEIMINNETKLVVQYIEENLDNEIINEKLQRFNLSSKNDVNHAINYICDLLSF